MTRKFCGFALTFFLFLPLLSHARPQMMQDPPIQLEPVHIDVHSSATVLRGAQFFAKNCMVCHTMKYLVRDKFAQMAGITADKMPAKNQQWWFKNTPPDLTLIARVYSPAWLFTYLSSFYEDKNHPLGSNNLLVPNVNMPNPFVGLQGVQEYIRNDPDMAQQDAILDNEKNYYTLLRLVKQGSMTPEEFNRTLTDLVTFLTYAADPTKVTRERAGMWALGGLIILLVLLILLKRAYWRDLKNKKNN